MPKNNTDSKREYMVRQQPTIYTFNFKDIPTGKYAETLEVLFHNPDYNEAVEKRNRLVMAAKRVRQGSNEMNSLVRTIQQHDRRLAEIMYASIVQTNVHSEVKYDFMSFNTLLKYYVDYSKEGMKKKTERLAANLDKVTFIADMLENLVTDVKADMRDVFDEHIEFNQFDAVQKVLTQLRGFFKTVRGKDDSSPEAQLYFDYSDSINEYVGKRLKTYSAKYRKMHPAVQPYDETDLVEALKQFFRKDENFYEECIAHTVSGGCYINACSLCRYLDRQQIKRIEETTADMKPDSNDDEMLMYNFKLTDAIMEQYKRPSKTK